MAITISKTPKRPAVPQWKEESKGSWTLKLAPDLTIHVHHHIDYPPSAWLLSCYDLRVEKLQLLVAGPVETAWVMAMRQVEMRLATRLKLITNALVDPEETWPTKS